MNQPNNTKHRTLWSEYSKNAMTDSGSRPQKFSSTPSSWSNLESNGVSVTLVTNNEPSTKNEDTSPSNGLTITARGDSVSKLKRSFPLSKDGTAQCENCGKVGVKHAFYTKKRNFCSLQCSKMAFRKNEADKSNRHMYISDIQKEMSDSSDNHSRPGNSPQTMEDADDSSRSSSAFGEREAARCSSAASNNMINEYESDGGPAKKKKKKMEPENTSYDWSNLLDKNDFVAAGVNLFRHAPLARAWDNVIIGMKLEVENRDLDRKGNQPAYWVATVLKIQGYKVKLRYEGFGDDPREDFWVNLSSEDIHHVGWCANKGKPLIPPRDQSKKVLENLMQKSPGTDPFSMLTAGRKANKNLELNDCYMDKQRFDEELSDDIAAKYDDWRQFLVSRLTGARTLPHNFQTKIASNLKSKNEIDMELEVVDKNRISQLRVARVRKIIGRRLHVEYFDSTDDGGFWCHEESRLIHQRGWAATVGHEILAPKNYNPPLLPSTPYDAEYENLGLQPGMKLEAIDPLNLSAICAATIKKVLRRGYIMIRVDCYEEDDSGDDWFCYHISSPYVLPCGFCAENKVVLTPPFGYDKHTFRWDDYLRRTKAVVAPVPTKKTLDHGLKPKMAVEAADLMDPRLICPATISKVVGRLLKIHFDGWDEEYDQWMDARSPDVYPVGWCELADHALEYPRPPQPSKKVKKGKKLGKKLNKAGKGPGKASTKKIKKEDSSPVISAVAGSSGGTARTSSLQHMIVHKNANRSDMEVDGVTEPRQPAENTIVKTESFGPTVNLSSVPRLVGNSNCAEMSDIDPQKWSIQDVAGFLQANDCGSYCDGFRKNNVDGEKLLELTKDQIVILTGMKVGPALKILDIISQLKKYVTAARARRTATKP